MNQGGYETHGVGGYDYEAQGGSEEHGRRLDSEKVGPAWHEARPRYEQARSDQRPNVGRGPRNYTRSDERIREDICDRLGHSDLDVSDVEVQVVQGEVTLVGTVLARHAKHDAEYIAESVLGVKDVQNHIRVKRADEKGLAAHAETSGKSESGRVL